MNKQIIYLSLNKYYNSNMNNYGSETEKIRKHNKRHAEIYLTSITQGV